MLLWFAGLSVVLVWFVFRSPALDYRLVMLGSVVPVAEVLLGGPRLLHTLVVAVIALGMVMFLTRHQRLLRRRWISFVIGLMLHLVLDGVWTESRVFWWPFFGLDFGDAPLPELDRPVGVIVALELVGAAALVWFWRAFGLSDPDARQRFVRTGQLPRVPEAA